MSEHPEVEKEIDDIVHVEGASLVEENLNQGDNQSKTQNEQSEEQNEEQASEQLVEEHSIEENKQDEHVNQEAAQEEELSQDTQQENLHNEPVDANFDDDEFQDVHETQLDTKDEDGVNPNAHQEVDQESKHNDEPESTQEISSQENQNIGDQIQEASNSQEPFEEMDTQNTPQEKEIDLAKDDVQQEIDDTQEISHQAPDSESQENKQEKAGTHNDNTQESRSAVNSNVAKEIQKDSPEIENQQHIDQSNVESMQPSHKTISNESTSQAAKIPESIPTSTSDLKAKQGTESQTLYSIQKPIPENIVITQQMDERPQSSCVGVPPSSPISDHIMAITIMYFNTPIYYRLYCDTSEPMKFLAMAHTSLDVMSERTNKKLSRAMNTSANNKPKDLFLGFLFPVERYKLYGYSTNCQAKFVIIANDSDVKDFEYKVLLQNVHQIYAEQVANPFYLKGSKIESDTFDRRIIDSIRQFEANNRKK